ALIIGFAVLAIILISGGEAPVQANQNIAETPVDDPVDKSDLTNPDIGLNPEVPLNYNVDRIEDVSVPGPVDVAQAIGIQGAPPDNAVQNVPAPAGFGGGLGGGTPNDLAGR